MNKQPRPGNSSEKYAKLARKLRQGNQSQQSSARTVVLVPPINMTFRRLKFVSVRAAVLAQEKQRQAAAQKLVDNIITSKLP